MTRIAIIDDSELAVQWAALEFEDRGFDVVTHVGATGIPSFIEETRPRVLVLDVTMPGLDGDVVCGALKKQPTTKHVLIILHSSLPEDELAERAARCAADGFIVKTEDGEALCAYAERLIEDLTVP